MHYRVFKWLKGLKYCHFKRKKMELKNIILSKISHMQKGKNHIFFSYVNLKNGEGFSGKEKHQDLEVRVEEGKRGQRKGDHDQARVYVSAAVKLINLYN